MTEPFHLGVTGTRYGAAPAQIDAVRTIFELIHEDHGQNVRLHHGHCVGFDAQACGLGCGLGWPHETHPGKGAGRFRASIPIPAAVTHRELPMLERNKAIVAASALLVAAPAKEFDLTAGWRSGDGGTQFTVKWALGRGLCGVAIVWPDGGWQVTQAGSGVWRSSSD